MPAFAEKEKRPQPYVSAKPANSKTAASDKAQPNPNLQWTFGPQAVLQLKRASSDGSEKLAVNTPGDSYEQEADHISAQVMQMPEPQLQRACACGGGCSKCQAGALDHAHEHVQTKHIGSSDSGQTSAPPLVHEALASPGQPLDAATRAFMEPRFGHDFSHVRVHSGPVAGQSAHELNANAYTVGHNIVMDADRFAPATRDGGRLLAHELTHVVQQSGANGIHADKKRDLSPNLREGARLLVPAALSSPLGIARAPEKSFVDEDDEFRRQAEEDKAGRPREEWRTSGKQKPPTGAGVTRDAAQEIQQMIQEAKEGAYQHVNTANRQRATKQLRRLLDNYRASEMQRIDAQLATEPRGPARKALVAKKRVIVNERVKWQYQFDEAIRTPAGADAQSIYVHGGAAKPYHETRPGVGGYAQPDYTIAVSTERSGATRYHVNLKSHNLSDLTPARARAIAREVTAQATRNVLGDPKRRGSVGHLPGGDRLIISFIDQPDPMIQAEMNKIMLYKDGPITEVRFGTATHRLAGSSPTPQMPSPPTPTGLPPSSGPPPTKSTAAALPTPGTSKLPKGSVFETKSPSPPFVEETPPLPKGSVFEKYPIASAPDTESQIAKGVPEPAMPTKAAPAANVRTLISTGGSTNTGRVALDYESNPAGEKTGIKLTNIDLSDYPPDREGPVTRFFQNGAFQKLVSGVRVGRDVLSLVGQAAGGKVETVAKWVTEPIQSYFRWTLDNARAEFLTQFPDAASLLANSDVHQYRKRYEAAAAKLRVPENLKILLATGLAVMPDNKHDEEWHYWAENFDKFGIRPQDLSSFSEAGSDYENAMADLLLQLPKYESLLPGIAEDISQRASVLQKAGNDLTNVFSSLVMSPAGLIPMVYYELLGILKVASVFQTLGANMGGFANEISSRMSGYQSLRDWLDQQLVQVGTQLNTGVTSTDRRHRAE